MWKKQNDVFINSFGNVLVMFLKMFKNVFTLAAITQASQKNS